MYAVTCYITAVVLSKALPKNSGYILTVLSLGLTILGILILLYKTYLPTSNGALEAGEDTAVSEPDYAGAPTDYVVDKDIDESPVYPGTGNGSTAKNEQDQKLIKTGSLEMKVDDFDQADKNVRNLTRQMGGFVANSNDSGEGDDRALTISVKVPAASFDSFIEKIKTYGVEVVSFSENSSDITQAYTDLKARLKNQQAVETRLVGILDQATKVSEILEVERQLSATQQTIEQLKAQIEYYDSQIDMSSVTISMILNPESLDVSGDVWQPVGIFKEAVKSLVTMFKGLATIAIWLVVFSPVYGVVYLGYKLATRKK